MKISELLNEVARKDYSGVIDQLEQTPEFKEFSKFFDLKSTKIQRKNGSLQISTKTDILKEPRDFFVNYSGDIKVKNGYASIWGKAGYGSGPVGSLEMYKNCLKIVHEHFVNWYVKRMKNAKDDLTNLNLKTLVGRTYPAAIKSFNCSHNHLTSLEGAPTIPETGDFDCSHNELTSPLANTPNKCKVFSVQDNKITSFEGFPQEADFIHLFDNPITSFSNIHKYVKSCSGFTLPTIKTGVLAFFNVKECRSIAYWRAPNDKSEFDQVANIVSKHLSSEERDMIACQEELIDAGLKDFAEL